MTMNTQPAQVSLYLDGDNSKVFPAVIADKKWNGFAIPFFTRDVADQVAADLAAHDDGYTSIPVWDHVRQGYYLLAGGTLTGERLYVGNDKLALEDCELADGTDIDGTTRYTIGGGSWVWEVVEPAK